MRASTRAGPSYERNWIEVAARRHRSALSSVERSFSLPGQPRQVDVTVTRDGRAIGSSHLEPRYERVTPNGEECGPELRCAAVTDSVMTTELATPRAAHRRESWP